MSIYTDADDLDFDSIEREAYIRGDMTTAQLAAAASDRREEVSEMEEKISELEEQVSHLKDAPEDARLELRDAITPSLDDLFDLITNGKRISDREEMLRLVAVITKALP